MKFLRLFSKPVLQTLIFAILFSIVVIWFAVVFGLIDIGRIGIYFRQGAGSGLKLLVNVIVIAIAGRCSWVFLRYSLEDMNLVKKKDEWLDWRDEPDQDYLDGPALRADQPHEHTEDSLFPEDRWPGRTSLRRRRRSRTKIFWGYNKH